ncbi:MAG: DUF2264 domain-containing protein [Planctomycetota bacterium]|nr:MAG: DUF2264 domain-containing protein [Planctomycetota bacterium]
MNTRQRWLGWLERLALPVLTAAEHGCLRQELHPEHHADADPDRLASSHLEAVARLLIGIAPWLEADPSTGDTAEQELRRRLGQAARLALTQGFDPQHADWFCLDRGLQPIVDSAFISAAVLAAPRTLWQELPASAQENLVTGLSSLRAHKPYFNNWLLFSGISEAALAQCGANWDPMRVDYSLRQHEQWYVGDGVYGDGPRHHCDWYNSYVIHPLLHAILAALGDKDASWSAQRASAEERLRRYAAVQERCIAPDGSFPAVGRSITYRAGAFHALAYAALKDLLPKNLPPAQVRCALQAVLSRTLDGAGNWREDGFLRIGLTGHQPQLGEAYITTGSCYLTACALLPLGLPPEHPFWSEPDIPWTSCRIFDLGEDLEPDHALRD